MSSLQKIVALSLVVAFVFLAGCVRQQKETEYGNGVVIKELSVEPNVIESLENAQVVVTLVVQNLGEMDAKDVKATLLGLTDEWKISGDREKNIGDLYAAKPSLGIPEGEQSVITWTLTVPSGKLTQTTYPFSVKLTYDYSTVVEGLVRAVSFGYYRRTKESGGIKSFSYTAGPLKISAKVPSAIFSAGSEREIPIIFEIENVGEGRTYIDDEQKGLDKIKVKIDSTSASIRCSNTEAYLANGQKGLVSCTIEVPESTVDYADVGFKVTFEYNYLLEKPGAVTVLPSLVTS